jgi:hypothetical protein
VSRCTTGINAKGGKFATGISDTVGKFFHHFPPSSTIPAANCDTDTGGKIAIGVNDTGGK